MRMTQWIGLHVSAEAFIEENILTEKVKCPQCGCGEVGKKKIEFNGRVANGMFNDEIKLRTFYLKDGSILEEVVQCSPWSSGPMIFTCLATTDFETKFCEWPEEEVDRMC